MRSSIFGLLLVLSNSSFASTEPEVPSCGFETQIIESRRDTLWYNKTIEEEPIGTCDYMGYLVKTDKVVDVPSKVASEGYACYQIVKRIVEYDAPGVVGFARKVTREVYGCIY